MTTDNVTQLRPRTRGQETAVELRTAPLVPPVKLTKAQQALWDRFVEPATHLHEDSALKAYSWVVLAEQLVKQKAKTPVTALSQLRCLGNELGIGHLQKGAQKRAKPAATVTDKYFGK